MRSFRIIPILLLKDGGLYKSCNFKNYKYIGDPINTVRIFNEKEVDELIILDIEATIQKQEPNYSLLAEIASECFMPLCYGGGIRNLIQIEKILHLGFEKVIINTSAFKDPNFIREASMKFGSSTIVVSIDVRKSYFGYTAYVNSGRKNTRKDPVQYSKELEELGVGEILINSIDLEGTMKGYDHQLIEKICNSVNIPVVASGGAGSVKDMKDVVQIAGASAASAGSFFVFQGPYKAVLISYPKINEIN